MQRLPRLAIATLPGLDHFILDLAGRLAATGLVEVRVFAVRNASELPPVLAWTDQPDRDAVWFEFCWPPFPDLIARTDFAGRQVIVRVHRIEAYETDFVARTAWERVSDLLVVSHDMARCVREVRPGIDSTTRLHVVHNGVDLDAYPVRTQFDGFRIGWCGSFIARKNPTLALQILHELRLLDSRYRLHLAFGGADRLTMEAFCHQAALLRLGDAISFDGKLTAAAMPAWHAANGVLLSTSLHESFGYAIAEAAAAGCELAVLDHVGAAEFWPEEARFVTVADAVRLVRAAAPDRWRSHLARHFPRQRQVAAILAVLGQPHPQGAPAFDSARYWEQRYVCGGNSGSGSAGRLAAFKAEFLNRLVIEREVGTVLELGCGDGRQLALARYASYVGLDVSPAAVAMCQGRFAGDPAKRFLLAGTAEPPEADLALSLDVVFHLVEDEVFDAHMACLFGRARRLVVVYASDRDQPTAEPHVRHRAISRWVEHNAPAWRRTDRVANPFAFDPRHPTETSFCDFHVYERQPAHQPPSVAQPHPDAPATAGEVAASEVAASADRAGGVAASADRADGATLSGATLSGATLSGVA